jgi:hypothetical protein
VWRVIILITALALSACAQVTRAPDPPPPSEEPRGEVVSVTGLGEVKIGSTRADLGRHLDTEPPGCNTRLRVHPQGSLVFTSDGRFVLLWFDSPLRTSEGVTTGTEIGKVRAAYPGAIELTAPAGSHRFDGLLVVEGEHGYLFLHDGKAVQKAVAGYVDYLHHLFDTGFGSC